MSVATFKIGMSGLCPYKQCRVGVMCAHYEGSSRERSSQLPVFSGVEFKDSRIPDTVVFVIISSNNNQHDINDGRV